MTLPAAPAANPIPAITPDPGAGSGAGSGTPAPAAPSTAIVPVDATGVINGVGALLDTYKGQMQQLSRTPAGGVTPQHVFYATTGPVGRDSAGFSLLKCAGLVRGMVEAENAKEELHVCKQVKDLYCSYGFVPTGPGLIVPFATRHFPTFEPRGQALANEVRLKMAAAVQGADPDEMAWAMKQAGYKTAMGTLTEPTGAALVGFPQFMELIDLQRTFEAFTNAGCEEITLAPNGRMQWPKLKDGSIGYWVGEAVAITESNQTFGSLDLVAKKIGVLLKVNNELLRFTSPSTEALMRKDMARKAALKIDQAELLGTGGTQIMGLMMYDTSTTWTEGTDKVLAYTPTGGAADNNSGYKFTPEDAILMESKLPDAVDGSTGYIMRRDMYGILATRRNDAVSAGDKAGAFTFNMDRSINDRIGGLNGVKVVKSSNIPNNRTRGTGTTQNTIVAAGLWSDWIRARMGIMEFLSSTVGDTPLVYDQTWFRGIQHVDSGPRHLASFVVADNVLQA